MDALRAEADHLRAVVIQGTSFPDPGAVIEEAAATRNGDACDRLADYVCTCHADDEAYDCDDYVALAASPSSEVLDSCTVELDDLRLADEDAGFDCDV